MVAVFDELDVVLGVGVDVVADPDHEVGLGFEVADEGGSGFVLFVAAGLGDAGEDDFGIRFGCLFQVLGKNDGRKNQKGEELSKNESNLLVQKFRLKKIRKLLKVVRGLHLFWTV